MAHRTLITSFVFLTAVLGVAQGPTQANETSQAGAGAALPAQAHRILTKDPEYLKLLVPPLGNDFLQAYSKGYREKSAEIEAKVADISDAKLRSQARSNEWGRLLEKERESFRIEAEVTLNEAKILYSRKHRDALFEVGHVSYDETNNSLVVKATSTAPIDAEFRVIMNSAVINQIYEKFRQIAGQDIDQKTHDYVSNAGVGSNCSRNPGWCYKFGREEMERNLRSERMVVVAQGDLADRKIDHLFLVDYDTEAVLLDLDSHISALNTAAWRFSVGLIPTMSAELKSTETQVHPVEVASTESEPPPNQNKEGAGSGSSPPSRVRVPGDVTAAAIVTRTKPQYPLQARAGHIQGEVLLHAIIDREGKISDVQVLSGDDLLAQSALQAVRQWRYRPMLYDGEPTEVDTTITVTFSLVD